MATLSSVLTALAGPVVKKAMAAIGVGVISYVGVTTALQAVIDSAKSNFSSIAGDVATILAMAGFFTAIGIIAGGLMAGVALMTLTKIGKLSG